MTKLFITLRGIVDGLTGRIDREETGATAVEYGLMVGLIAVVIITAVTLLGDNLTAMFEDVAGELGASE